MALLAGIDEAGYGPTLGPLIVTGVAIRVPDDQLEVSLWNTLQETCTDTLERRGHRLTIADSKVLFKGRRTLAPLERAALVMLSVAGRQPETWRSLLDVFSPQNVEGLAAYPWYAKADVTLPLARGVGDIATRANAIRRNCRARGVGPFGIFGDCLHAGDYNYLLKKTDNKSVVLLGRVMLVVDRMLRSTRERRVRLCVDRLGGRQHYRDVLQTSFPDYALQILQENPDRSVYRLSGKAKVCDIEFVARGEQHHFAVALASVFSKYVRELHMHLLNGYWCARTPGLKPTAGYYTDAQRWLADVAPVLNRHDVDRSLLVRLR